MPSVCPPWRPPPCSSLWVSDFTGNRCLFLRASELGMQRCDNVDAVDVENVIQVHEEPPFEADPVEPQEPGDPTPNG